MTPCPASRWASARTAASSLRADRLTAAQLPSRTAVPGKGSGSEEAAAWDDAAPEDAPVEEALLSLEAGALSASGAEAAAWDESDRSRSRTTVYQVWVAQSST